MATRTLAVAVCFAGARSAFGVVLSGSEEPDGPPQKCLNFLHIPKAAGYSIEMTGQHRYIHAHGPNLWGQFAGPMLCSKTAQRDDGQKTDCVIPHVSPEVSCSKEHIPPARDGKIARYLADCDTFCVVRSPTTRLLSEFTYQGNKCTEGNVKKFVRHNIKAHNASQASPYRDDCHFVSQSFYVYGENRKVPDDHPRYCNRILRYENITEEFKALTAEYGYPNMELHMQMHTSAKNRCHMKDLMRPLVHAHYKADLENFGYEE